MLKKRKISGLTIVAFALFFMGCSTIKHTTGTPLRPDQIESLIPGQTTAEEVIAELGSPAHRDAFDDNIWFYIHQEQEQQAFLPPATKQRQVLRLVFDETQILQQKTAYDLDDAQDVALIQRETPTRGRDISLLEQLLGNLGRFNTGSQQE